MRVGESMKRNRVPWGRFWGPHKWTSSQAFPSLRNGPGTVHWTLRICHLSVVLHVGQMTGRNRKLWETAFTYNIESEKELTGWEEGYGDTRSPASVGCTDCGFLAGSPAPSNGESRANVWPRAVGFVHSPASAPLNLKSAGCWGWNIPGSPVRAYTL